MPTSISMKVVLDYIFFIILLLKHNGNVSPENGLVVLMRETFHKLQRTVTDTE